MSEEQAPNESFLSCRCTKHEEGLQHGPPELENRGVLYGTGLFRINLFPNMSCPGMWDGDNELADQICWDYWVAEVVAKDSDRVWLHLH